MIKIKMVAGLIALATSLIVMAAPVLAEFESTTGKSQGPIKIFPETTSLKFVEGGPAFECKSKNAEGVIVAAGGWQVQVKSTTQQGKYFYQAAAIKGPHEQLKIEKWGICMGPGGLPIVISCPLQVESNGTSFSATGSVYPSGCTFKFGPSENTCILNMQPDGNKVLQGVKLANGIVGVEIGMDIGRLTSITQESKTLCKLLELKGGQKTGRISTKNAFETEGQKLV